MIGSVFLETYKQTWKQMVYWGVGLAAMALLVVMMVPLFDMQQMKELLASFPPVILAMIGVGGELDIFATNRRLRGDRFLREIRADFCRLSGGHGHAHHRE